MKKLTLVLALVPALALAAPQTQPPGRGSGGGPGPGAGPGGGWDDAARVQRMEKRVRLAATLGLAEALDLDDQAAMHVRDVIGKDTERRLPLKRQIHENLRVLRDAARGDKAAAGQVDGALAKLRDVRTQLQKLDDETFQQLTQGLSPDKKAKAALFLARFRERGRHMAMMRGGPGGGPGWGSGHRGPGPGGPGAGPRGPMNGGGRGPGLAPGGGGGTWMMGMDPERHASAMVQPGEPELEDWYGED